MIRVPERGPIRFREVIRTVANDTGIEIEMTNGESLLSITSPAKGTSIDELIETHEPVTLV